MGCSFQQLPVDHPTIQEMPISFEGFGEALYCANADDVELFFIKNSAHRTGATLSLALFSWSALSKEKDRIDESRRAEEDKKVIMERQERWDQMTWIERFLKAAITDVGVPFPIKVLLKLLTPEFNKLKRL
ncbi:hypothetical protein H112_06302 [Trichophyton rubrum D6]|uniref:Uncharacterized protein n=3 Tax=Trichophyton TaxID=5550 RepID=F2SHE2_TRIRC|nr:uncharacterized protein TERG_01673 [Trichophyton rubrum CBS 118892]EZF13153.1 hypothetical protein H100_06316 [Trichophyton rubrum MR850]EZF39683.1 hypothetical protein H102_06283 [Trichophyton rubrum CBS 100081]EZF50207.1 hypothetical protein H103_06308 [Trichophyton rubrum CBS 288.86]EZF60839.1 hypothetical protein H104_06295 [Trichophyton rubrum CBS 289.86]EZF71357.1 hypothetical protein H105_06323 [Trichophyton soudanense CBS 452.61]EZF82166.1 hypothetical protein H110_06305 [Trichophy